MTATPVRAGSIVTRCGITGCGRCFGNCCSVPGGWGIIWFWCGLGEMSRENNAWKCERNPKFYGPGYYCVDANQRCGGQQLDVCEGGGQGCTGGPRGRLRDFIVYRDENCVQPPTQTPTPPPCINSCPGVSRPNYPNLSSPANGANLLNRTVTFSWSHSGWGSCGGNNCTGSCASTSPRSYRITINGVGTYNTGTGRSFSRTLNYGSYSWYVSARNGCGQTRTSSTWSFRINRPPTATGSIVSNQTCNGAAQSVGWSGIHPSQTSGDGSAGINNPLRVRGVYTDGDGANDLNRLYAWVSSSSRAPSSGNIGVAAYGQIRYNNGNYRLVTSQGSEQAPGGNTGICSTGSTVQTFCDINNPPANATAFAYPASVTRSGNTVFVDWQMGMLSSSAFTSSGSSIRYDVYASDRPGATTGWIWRQSWNADLTYPVPSLNQKITSEKTFNVTFSQSDNNGVILSRNRSCRTTGNQKPVTMTQTSPNPPGTDTVNFPVGGITYDPCIDNNTGLTSYDVDNIPKEGSLSFGWNVTDRACNTAPTETTAITLKPPWLMTVDGDTYSANSYVQTKLSQISKIINPLLDTLHDTIPHLSTYNYMQQIDSLPESRVRESISDYINNNYLDLNGKPRPESGFPDWFTFLKNRVANNFEGVTTTLTPAQLIFNNTTTNNIGNVPVNGPAGSTLVEKVNVVESPGNLTLTNITCNTKTIFFINGHLTIDPEFTILDNPTVPSSGLNMNGCLFIVAGKTTIREGSVKASPDTEWTPYDEVQTFIVTDNFISEKDLSANGLKITGGVITNQNNQFLRDNGVVLNQFSPSELFIYDGGRYIRLFGGLLDTPVGFTIQEKPFIESITTEQ